MKREKILLWIIPLFVVISGCATYRVTKARSIEIEGKLIRYDEIKIAEPRASLPVGERLTYDVAWLGIPVGEVTMEITEVQQIRGRNAYRIELRAKTNKFCSSIYPVDDKYISYMDVENLSTLRHEVSRREGRYKKDAVTDFDQENYRAYFRNLLDGSEKDFSIPANIQDTLTAIYYFRTINVSVGDKINYEVASDEKVYSLDGSIEKKEFIRIRGLKTFEAFLLVPYAKLKEERVRKADVIGYFSVDPSRIPLVGIIKGPIFTKVTVSLAKVENILEDRYGNL